MVQAWTHATAATAALPAAALAAAALLAAGMQASVCRSMYDYLDAYILAHHVATIIPSMVSHIAQSTSEYLI